MPLPCRSAHRSSLVRASSAARPDSYTGTVAQITAAQHNRDMKPVHRVLAGLCLTSAMVVVPAAAAAAAGSGTAVVKPSAEAWYRTTPACTLPIGCVDATGAPSPYPAQTLHVGVNAGQEEARTYLQLDLAGLPSGTKPSGGTLLLPVAGGGDSGTRSPETATIQACAVSAAVEDADGSFATPPEADCDAASVPATYVAAEGENPAALTVALADLVTAWDGGSAPGAVALLPSADTAPPATWHVAFSGRERQGEGVVPISARLSYVSASVDTAEEPAPVVPPPPFEPVTEAPQSFDTGTSFAAPPLTVDTPVEPQPAPQPAPVAAAPEQQVVPVASVVDTTFRYPAVFLLPLAVAVLAGWLGRALTRDLAPV